MKQAVVIGTYFGNREPLEVLLESLSFCKYPVYVIINDRRQAPDWWVEDVKSWGVIVIENDHIGFELGCFKLVLSHTDIDEFVFLQDTFEVKDQSFLDICFARPESVALGPTFFHYAGKWKCSVLREMDIPRVDSKNEAIHWEHAFSRLYWEREPVWIFDPTFHDGQHKGFVDAFGRTNMLLENDYYLKRKGDWGQR